METVPLCDEDNRVGLQVHDSECAISRLARQHHFAQMKECCAVCSFCNSTDKRPLSANVDQRVD
jgi:hypothetical protein